MHTPIAPFLCSCHESPDVCTKGKVSYKSNINTDLSSRQTSRHLVYIMYTAQRWEPQPGRITFASSNYEEFNPPEYEAFEGVTPRAPSKVLFIHIQLKFVN